MNYKKIATGISWVLHPFLLPVYLMAVLLTMTAFSHYPPNVKFYLLWVVALYAIVIPLLSLGVLRSLGRISDYRIDDRRERFLPLLVGAVCYVLCAITIAKIPSAIFLRQIHGRRGLLRGAVSRGVVLLEDQPSPDGHGGRRGAARGDERRGRGQHARSPHGRHPLRRALASARLYLGCHNGWQVLAGFCGGFAVSVLAVLFL